MIPASGTVGFPVDGNVRIFLDGFDHRLRARLGEEYRLRDAKGALVSLEARIDGTMLTLAPRAHLHPGRRYTVERVFGYSEKGERLSDDERWQLAELGVRRRSWRGPATSSASAAAPHPPKGRRPRW